MSQVAWFTVLLVAVAACAPAPESEGMADTQMPSSDQRTQLEGREWVLDSIGSIAEPRGAQGKPVTIRFDAAEGHAGGYSGCNQYGAAYTIQGDSISFQAAISTKMFCEGAMEVETALLGALERVTRFQVSDSTLTLFTSEGPVARFRVAPPS